MERFFEIIRARKLDRVGAAYAVAAWIIVQAASIALPAYDAPAWVLRWLIVAAVVGFPTALSAAWVLNGAGQSSIQRAIGRRELTFLSAIGLVALLTVGEVAWHLSSSQLPASSPSLQQPLDASIAVLPFSNTSGDSSQRYFSEGVSEELIGLLARNRKLRVAAKTSSFFFEGKNEDVRVIARKLNVRTILEGSIRQDRDRVRIEAALINGADGYQIWSESYDRNLTDILTLQSEIAGAIVESLVPEITGQSPKSKASVPGPIDPDAYRMYLEGQFYFDKRTDADVERALNLFRQVASIAPNFADGRAALAYALLIASGASPQNRELADQFKAALAQALQMDPSNPQTLTVALIDASDRWDWSGVLRFAVRLKQTGSHSAIAFHGLAIAYGILGLRGRSIAADRQAARLDPLSISALWNIEASLFTFGRYQELIPASEAGLALDPTDWASLSFKCVALARTGRISAAESILAHWPTALIQHHDNFDCGFFTALASGKEGRARAMAEDLAAHYKDFDNYDESSVGFILAQAGEYDRAMDWYERSFRDRSFDFGFNQGPSLPKAFFQNPRWIALTRHAQYQAWQAACTKARAIFGPDLTAGL